MLLSFNTTVIETTKVDIVGNHSRIRLIDEYFSQSKITPDKLKHLRKDLRNLTSIRPSFGNCLRKTGLEKLFTKKCSTETSVSNIYQV